MRYTSKIETRRNSTTLAIKLVCIHKLLMYFVYKNIRVKFFSWYKKAKDFWNYCAKDNKTK